MTLRSGIGRLLRPIFLAIGRRLSRGDPWERLDTAAPATEFGPRARRPIAQYLREPTHVPGESLQAVRDWLLAARYQRAGTEGSAPVWPTLIEFERAGAGDCTAFAPWAWRKLVDLGLDATLVVGRRPGADPPGERHAWVTYRSEGVEYLLETTARAAARQVRATGESTVRSEYLPEVGVDSDGWEFAFRGLLIAMSQRLASGDPSGCTRLTTR